MRASRYGYVEIVRTVLEYGADVGVKNNVRNLVMMMIELMTMKMMMMVTIVIMSIMIMSHRWIIFFVILLFAPNCYNSHLFICLYVCLYAHIYKHTYKHMSKCELLQFGANNNIWKKLSFNVTWSYIHTFISMWITCSNDKHIFIYIYELYHYYKCLRYA